MLLLCTICLLVLAYKIGQAQGNDDPDSAAHIAALTILGFFFYLFVFRKALL